MRAEDGGELDVLDRLLAEIARQAGDVLARVLPDVRVQEVGQDAGEAAGPRKLPGVEAAKEALASLARKKGVSVKGLVLIVPCT